MDLSIYAADLAVMHDTPVLRFAKVSQDSDYVGKTYVWQPQGVLNCGCYPVKDAQSIELYGPRINQMFRLHFAPGTVICDGDGISFDTTATEPQYTVIEAPKGSIQTKVTIEVIGVGNPG